MLYINSYLYVRPGKEDIFESYESQVLPLLKDHQGTLIYRIRPHQKDFISANSDTPFEVHLLSFPDQQKFDNYLNDPRRIALDGLKNEAIINTLIIKELK